MTQREMADVFGQTASNISHYEMGKQELPPACARALISYAQNKNEALTFEEIYDVSALCKIKHTNRPSDDCGRRVVEGRRSDEDRRSAESEKEAA